MDKLMQMLSNSMEKQQQQQQQQQQNDNTNSDDVMRFFRNITPPPSLNSSLSSTNPLNTSSGSHNVNNNNNNNNNYTKSLFEQGSGLNLPKQNHFGIYLYGKSIEVDSNQFSKISREIESQTLTIINNNKKDYFLGNCITTNTNYICYVIKGKVRILDGTSANKALIKNEFKEANDVQFHPSENTDLLSVCSSPETSCFVYGINKLTDGSIEPTLLATIPSPSKTPFSYACWHPTSKGILAICPSINSSDHQSLPIYLFNIYSSNPSEPILKISPPSRETFYGASFSSDGSLLALCTGEGTISIYTTTLLHAQNTELLYSKKYNGKRLRTVQFIGKDILLLTTSDTEILVVRFDSSFEILQQITFRPPLSQEFNLVSFKDQFLFIADSSDNKCYSLHFNSQSNQFDYITSFDFKTPVFSFTIKTVQHYDQNSNSSNPSSALNPLANSDPRSKKQFFIYTFQSNAIYRFRLVLSDDYLTSDSYIESNLVLQKHNIEDNNQDDNKTNGGDVSIFNFLDQMKSTNVNNNDTEGLVEKEQQQDGEDNDNNNNNNNSEDVDNVLLTPKSFSQTTTLPLSSPPPVSLPDPELFNNSPTTTAEEKKKKKKKSKNPKDQEGVAGSTSPSPSHSPNIEDGILAALELKKKVKESSTTNLLGSPSSGNATSTLTKSKSNSSLTSTSTSTTPTPTSPQQPIAKNKAKSEKSNVTPSFIPPPLNIPASNPLHVTKLTKSSSTNTSSTNLNTTSPLPTTTIPEHSPQNLSPPTSSTSSSISSSSSLETNNNINTNISNQSIISMFKEMENHLFNRFEKSIEKDRLEREALEKDRQEKLLQQIQLNLKSNIEKIVKKEVSTLMTGVEKSIQSTIETSVTKSTGDYLKKITTKATENLTQQLKATITSENFDNQIKSHMETVFLTYFKSTLIPGFEKSCKEMFKHLSNVYSKGFNENMQQQNLAVQSLHLNIQQTVQNELKVVKEANQSNFSQFTKDRESLVNDVKLVSQQSQQFIQQQQQLLVHQQQQHQIQHQQQHQHQQQQQQHMYNSPISQRPMPPLSTSTGMPEMPVSFMNNPMSMLPPSMHPSQIPSPQQSTQNLPPPSSPSNLATYPVLKTFIDKGEFVNAFNFSLNASNLQMVVSLCQSLDPPIVFSKQQMPANTILSLIQQLSIDLPTITQDSETRLRWIREGLSAFDMKLCGRPDVAKKIFNTLKLKLEQPQIQSAFPHYVNSIKQLLPRD